MWSSLQPLPKLSLAQPFLSNSLDFINKHPVLSSCVAGVFMYGLWFFKRPKNMPPGPYGYPLIGNQILFVKAIKEKFKTLTEKYGDMFTLWLGGDRYLVLLTSYQAIKDVYINSGGAFMDRHADEMASIFGVTDSIFNAHYDETQKESRKIFLQRLRVIITSDLGKMLQQELAGMEAEIDDHLGEPLDLKQWIYRIYMNIITQVLYNKRHGNDESDALGQKLIKWNEYFTDAFGVLFLPKLQSSLILQKPLALGREITKEVMKYVKENLDQHVALSKRPPDILTAFIEAGSYTESQIVSTLFTLMTDAAHAGPLSTLWILIYLTNHPEIQEVIYKEIEDICGKNIDLASKSSMPITESFIMEVLRCVTPIAIAVPNKPLRTESIRGYTIPENAIIIAYLEAPHNDPALFPDPSVFKPGRFIKDGKIGNTQGFMPFGIGRRMCVGEQLMRHNMFYIVTRLVQKYKLSPPNGVPISTEVVDDRFVTTPHSFKINFTKR